MGYSMSMRDAMRYEKKKSKKIKIDGKEYDLDEFDDRHYWTKPKKKK